MQNIKIIKQPTFMGRRVIEVEREGEVVEAIEGRYAYRLRKSNNFSLKENEKRLIRLALNHTDLDEMGIGIMQTHLNSDSLALQAIPEIAFTVSKNSMKPAASWLCKKSVARNIKATCRSRTDDLSITNRMLYQLS